MGKADKLRARFGPPEGWHLGYREDPRHRDGEVLILWGAQRSQRYLLLDYRSYTNTTAKGKK